MAFFTLALISTKARRSFPIAVEQVVRSAAEQAAAKAKAATTAAKPPPKRKPGRPKGSSATAKASGALSPELTRIQSQIRARLERIGGVLPLTSLVLDGHCGNAAALHMARECKLHLMSNLRSDSALYLPYDGPYAGHGPQRIYGDKLNPRAIPARYLCQTTVVQDSESRIYQLQARHKTCAQLLNVVCSVKTNLKTHAPAHGLLFSRDLA